MSRQIEPIEHGKYYHIYNRGINGENLFREKANYLYFLKLYDKYIEHVAETFAWCLMPNHFHLLVRIKDESEIGFIPIKHKPPTGLKATVGVSGAADGVSSMLAPAVVENPDGGLNTTNRKYNPSHQFSHLFNAYAQAYNKKYGRHGSLFENPFDRILVDNEKYYKNLVVYIHNNPSHHLFVEDSIEYPWTSYLTVKSAKPTKLMRSNVIRWFDDIENFESVHKKTSNYEEISSYLIE
jgi:hypothetical protein